jgi:hypothetical protein
MPDKYPSMRALYADPLNVEGIRFMPAATPQPIVQKFTNAVAEASRKPALKAAIENAQHRLQFCVERHRFHPQRATTERL